MNLKKQLSLLLKMRGMTAAELARQARVPKQSISGWMAGSNPRDVRQVKQVADILGVTLDHLLFGGEGTQKNILREESSSKDDSDDWVGGLFEIKFRRIKK